MEADNIGHVNREQLMSKWKRALLFQIPKNMEYGMKYGVWNAATTLKLNLRWCVRDHFIIEASGWKFGFMRPI